MMTRNQCIETIKEMMKIEIGELTDAQILDTQLYVWGMVQDNEQTKRM